ncbi:MAG: UDP-N-acetylglucosamine 1-carboxyvinyltransferase [Myxococcota bacterium]
MDEIVITGGKKLSGEVMVGGAKNAALPLIAATLLAPGKNVINNVPNLADVRTMLKLFSLLGAPSHQEEKRLRIDTSKIDKFAAPYELVKTMRASVLVLAPLLARYGNAKVSLPGGCAIGARPIDQHLKALEALGAEIAIEHGYVIAKAKRLRGAEIIFDLVTVTGTENALMAAVLAKGETTIRNAAREPEVVDLANALIKSGAKIAGAGTEEIVVVGVEEILPLEHTVIGDRIEAGTLLLSAAVTGGEVTVRGIPPEFLTAELKKFADAGMRIKTGEDWITLKATPPFKAVNLRTSPYPGFATDMQAQFVAAMTTAKGTSLIEETIFENRFMHILELQRMGADIKISGRVAAVTGVEKLSGAPVMATDLRASASLIIAGLAAENTTIVSRVYHLDRGYERLDEKLRALGAEIARRKAVIG